ncbi:MAG: DUF2505 family protein [Sandaracinaceae bacterium]
MRRVHIEHPIGATLERVERALLADATLAELAAALPEVGRAESLQRVEEGAVVRRVARFEARVTPPLFRRVLVEPVLAWREEVVWDRAMHTGTFRVVPNLVARRASSFRCEGIYRLEARGDATLRVVDGELTIALGLLAHPVERLIESQLGPHFRIEAEVLERLAR